MDSMRLFRPTPLSPVHARARTQRQTCGTRDTTCSAAYHSRQLHTYCSPEACRLQGTTSIRAKPLATFGTKGTDHLRWNSSAGTLKLIACFCLCILPSPAVQSHSNRPTFRVAEEIDARSRQLFTWNRSLAAEPSYIAKCSRDWELLGRRTRPVCRPPRITKTRTYILEGSSGSKPSMRGVASGGRSHTGRTQTIWLAAFILVCHAAPGVSQTPTPAPRGDLLTTPPPPSSFVQCFTVHDAFGPWH